VISNALRLRRARLSRGFMAKPRRDRCF